MKNLIFVLFPFKGYRLGRNDPSPTFNFWRGTMHDPVEGGTSDFLRQNDHKRWTYNIIEAFRKIFCRFRATRGKPRGSHSDPHLGKIRVKSNASKYWTCRSYTGRLVKRKRNFQEEIPNSLWICKPEVWYHLETPCSEKASKKRCKIDVEISNWINVEKFDSVTLFTHHALVRFPMKTVAPIFFVLSRTWQISLGEKQVSNKPAKYYNGLSLLRLKRLFVSRCKLIYTQLSGLRMRGLPLENSSHWTHL